MKMYGRLLGIAGALFLGCAVSGFSNDSLAELQKRVNTFSEKMAESLPFNASIGLNWSDAYIGQLLGIPPHFGIGISGGATSMDSDSLKQVLDSFGKGSSIDRMIMPAYVLEGRIGGFFLPFDLGIKFGILPEVSFGNDLKLDYLLVGGDIRYAVLKGGIILPTVSVGVGINHLRGGLSTPFQGSFTVGGNTLTLTDSTADFTWKTTALDLKAQVSKSFFFITPYLGLGLSHAWSEAGYSVKGNLQYPSGNNLKEDIQNASIQGIDVNTQGFSSIISNTGWSLRAFGGLSFNIALIKLDITGMFNFLDTNWGATFGIRFQL